MFEFSSQTEQFRAKADMCFARSKRVPDSEYQRIFYGLAVEWLALTIETDCKDSHQIASRD